MCSQVLFEFHKGNPQVLFLKSSKHSPCFAFNETIFKVDVQNGFVSESFSFEHHCVEETIFINKINIKSFKLSVFSFASFFFYIFCGHNGFTLFLHVPHGPLRRPWVQIPLKP